MLHFRWANDRRDKFLHFGIVGQVRFQLKDVVKRANSAHLCAIASLQQMRRMSQHSSFSQEVGVLRSLLPTSLFEHLSMGQARHPSTQQDDTLCVIRALVPTFAVQPPHVCHRLETGLSPLARTCSRT